MARRRAGASPRALGLLAVGAAALVAARGFGTPALAVLGAGLVALPLLAAALVGAAAAGTRLERGVEPGRAVAGDACRVRVRLTGWAPRLGLVAVLDWSVDPGTGTLGAPGPARRRRASTEALVEPVHRGVHHLPPPALRVADPFGLVRLVRRGGGTATVVVVPAAPALRRPFWAAGGMRPDAAGAAGRGRGGGELEGVRDHRPGDPLSRIHWPQTAKRGRLQAKELRGGEGGGREALVLLDDRGDPEIGGKPDGAFETAVTAAAALVRHLSERGLAVGLAAPGSGLALAAARGDWAGARQALAAVEAVRAMPVSLALRAACGRDSTPRRVVVVTAAPDAGLPDAVRAARASGRSVACALCGPGGAAAGALARAGARVAWLPGLDGLAAALSGEGRDARVG